MMKISAIPEENMSNLTSASNDSSTNNGEMFPPPYFSAGNQSQSTTPPPPAKKKRSQPGHPDPGSEVIALSPRALLATNRFVCEICNKGFQRDQNLQLHRRGHNLPWKLKQRSTKDVRKKVYVCPETSCVHHDPSRALGDLTGIKKHFCRKHGEKKWKCEKCSKKYAVQSDWKAHSKTCGTREYRCDCGTLFSRRDSFITHRAFCDALAEESAKSINGNSNPTTPTIPIHNATNNPPSLSTFSHHMNLQQLQSQFSSNQELPFSIKKEQQSFSLRPPWLSSPPTLAQCIDLTAPSSIFQDFQENHQLRHNQTQNPNPNSSTTTASMGSTAALQLPFHHHHPPPHISATALLQKAAEMGAKSSSSTAPSPAGEFSSSSSGRPHHAHVPAGEPATAGFGLKLSSRDQFINALAPFAAKAASVTGGDPPPASSSFLHDMMVNAASAYGHHHGSSTFEDDYSFASILNNNSSSNNNNTSSSSSKKVEERLDFDATLNPFSSRNSSNGRNGDGLTRDFLGLRPLSQSDILSLAGLSNCMNNSSSSCTENQNQPERSWQD